MKKIRDIRSFFNKTRQTDQQSLENTTNEKSSDTSPAAVPVPVPVPVPGTSFDSSLESSIKEIPQSKIINDLGSLQTGPCQPRIDFPRTKFGEKLRTFNAQNYDKYTWLEYSINENKVYCFVCRIFGKEMRDQNEKFTITGYSNWKKLSEALQKHAQSAVHNQSKEMHYTYLHQGSNVHEQIVTQHEKEVEQNKENLLKIIDIILYLVRQGLPLRGHRETAESKNKGNFLEMVQLFAKYDETFSKHLEKHVTYCSAGIQNDLISIMNQITIEGIIIVNKITQCGFFSIMVDEARCYKEEKMSIVLRYVIGLEVEESFMGFMDCSTSRDAKSLAAMIIDLFNKCGLNNVPIIAQSYDGASVMSGKHKGLQAIIKEKYPHAIYVHCLAHKLNLAVVDSCANVSPATKFFNNLEALYIHFSHPGNHAHLKQIQDSLGIKTGRDIGSLSTTRWSCRYENCKAVINSYDALRTALEEEICQNKDKHVAEAVGLLTAISKPEFIVCLHVFHSALSIIQVLSKYFQGKSATLGQAGTMITGVISTFEQYRNNFDARWKEIEEFAEKYEISLEPTKVSKRKHNRVGEGSRNTDFYIESTLGRNNWIDLSSDIRPSEYWKINICYPVIDNIIVNMKNRFESVPLAQSIDAFSNLDLENGKAFIDNYEEILQIDRTLLGAECLIMKNVLKDKTVTIEVLREHIKQDFCPNLFKLIQAAIVIPVSSAGCERSFSAMRRIKTWLRSTMGEERFSSTTLLHVENKHVKENVTPEMVLKVFAEKKRKLKLV